MTYKALLYHGPASAYILHPELYKELSKCQAPFKARTFHCRRLHILCGQRACMLSCVWLSGTPWTAAHQAPLLTAFPRQEYWSGSPCPPPEGLPDPGIELASLAFPALQVDSLPLSHWGCLTTVLKSRWPVTFSQVLWHLSRPGAHPVCSEDGWRSLRAQEGAQKPSLEQVHGRGPPPTLLSPSAALLLSFTHWGRRGFSQRHTRGRADNLDLSGCKSPHCFFTCEPQSPHLRKRRISPPF